MGASMQAPIFLQSHSVLHLTSQLPVSEFLLWIWHRMLTAQNCQQPLDRATTLKTDGSPRLRNPTLICIVQIITEIAYATVGRRQISNVIFKGMEMIRWDSKTRKEGSQKSCWIGEKKTKMGPYGFISSG